MADTPVLTTARLRLRPRTVDDAEALFPSLSDPALMTWWSHAPHETVEQTRASLSRGAPGTLAAAPVGASGVVRAGQEGHPLSGIVDIAAAVEQGGTSAPTGKWRVDLGPLGGDGVHPSGLGENVMAGPTADWVATLV